MNLVYGIVLENTFHSGRMRRHCEPVHNGIYSMDMEEEDFAKTRTPAPIQDAIKDVRKASRMAVIRGGSFGSGFVPENPVNWAAVPISVVDPTYDEFEEIEVVRFHVVPPSLNAWVAPAGYISRPGQDVVAYYFLQAVETQNTYTLMDLKSEIETKKPRLPSEFKGVTPEMRVVYSLHMMEKKKREEKEPLVAVKLMMEEVGATVEKVVPTNRGFEVTWKFDKYRFLTIFDKQLKVVHAGYCVRNHDNLLSPTSLVNALKDGIVKHGNDGMIHSPVAYDGERFGADDDLDDDPDADPDDE